MNLGPGGPGKKVGLRTARGRSFPALDFLRVPDVGCLSASTRKLRPVWRGSAAARTDFLAWAATPFSSENRETAARSPGQRNRRSVCSRPRVRMPEVSQAQRSQNALSSVERSSWQSNAGYQSGVWFFGSIGNLSLRIVATVVSFTIRWIMLSVSGWLLDPNRSRSVNG